MIPKQLEIQVVEWYHNAFYHPGETHIELSISQHFYWQNIRKIEHEICTKCKTCQFLKRKKKPPKEVEAIPWYTLCVDLIGKYQFTPRAGGKKFQIVPKGDEKRYKMTTKSGKSVYLQAVTMIDPATGWIEICTVLLAWTEFVANQVELAWLTCYPQPNKVIVDRVNEFLAEFRAMMINDYCIKVKQITSRSPQANAILERVY